MIVCNQLKYRYYMFVFCNYRNSSKFTQTIHCIDAKNLITPIYMRPTIPRWIGNFLVFVVTYSNLSVSMYYFFFYLILRTKSNQGSYTMRFYDVPIPIFSLSASIRQSHIIAEKDAVNLPLGCTFISIIKHPCSPGI